MRNISFSMTTPQFIAGTKDVTRRTGWKKLKPGDHLMGVQKGMGLKPGEKILRLGAIEIVDVTREPLSAIEGREDECVREGFPNMRPNDFIRMFQRAHPRLLVDEYITRIEFKPLVDWDDDELEQLCVEALETSGASLQEGTHLMTSIVQNSRAKNLDIDTLRTIAEVCPAMIDAMTPKQLGITAGHLRSGVQFAYVVQALRAAFA